MAPPFSTASRDGRRRLSFRAATGAVLPAAMLALLVVLLLRALGAAMHGADFNADAWTILDLSRHLGGIGAGDFYRVNIVRQYNLDLDHGSSYGFLAPALLFVVNGVHDLGVYGLFFAMAAAGCALPLPLYVILRKTGAKPPEAALGALALFALALGIPEFFADLFRASTIPLSALLLLTMLALLPAEGAPGRRRVLLLGALGGLAALNRFDVNLYVAAFALVVFAGSPGRRLGNAALYVCALLLTLSPWILYSLAVFGRPYVSDNGAVALSVDRFYVTDLIPAVRATLLTDPAGWAARVGGNAAETVRLLAGMWLGSAVAQGITLGSALLAGALAVSGRLATPPRYAALMALGALASVLLCIGPVLTGYQENIRYFSITILLVLLAAMALLGGAVWRTDRGHVRGMAGGVPEGARWPVRLLSLALLGAFVLVLPPVVRQAEGLGPAAFRLKPANRALDPDSPLDAAYLRCLPDRARVFMLYPYDNPRLGDSLRFGAMSDRMVFLMPGNWRSLPLAEKLAFLKEARLTHVVVDESRPTEGLTDPAMGLAPVAGCPGVHTVPTP